MARRRVAAKRKITPDPLYNNEIIAKFINSVMRNGKKSVAEKIVYGALEEIGKRIKHTPTSLKEEVDNDDSGGDDGKSGSSGGGAKNLKLEIFFKAIENVSPIVEVRAKRVGGSTYQIPVEVRPERKRALSMRWLIEAAQGRSGQSLAKRLAAELMDAAEERGGAFKKKEETHRMAKSNQAFAHIRAA